MNPVSLLLNRSSWTKVSSCNCHRFYF